MTLEGLVALYAAGVAGWEAARRTRLGRSRPFLLLDLVGWAWALPAVPLAAVAVVRGRPRALVPLAVPAAVHGRRLLPRPRPPRGGSRLRVMVANLYMLNPDPREIARPVREVDADLVALHELTPAMASVLESELGDRYPYRDLHSSRGSWGLGLMSKHPLVGGGHEIGPDLSRQEAVLRVGDRRIAVLNVHPLPPGERPFSFDPRVQAEGLDEIMRRADAAPEPMVLLGDFNVSDRMPAYRRLSARHADAFAAAGRGFGFTWPHPLPLVRIDHVFCRGLEPVSAWTGVIPGSDHRYVAAELLLSD